MTPENIVGMAYLAGLDAIAVCDHNTCENCAAAISAGQKRGICVLPGMELMTSEEIHVLFLFSKLDGALEFSDYVYSKLPKLENKPDIFGNQLVYGDGDVLLRSEPRLLSAATEIGIYETARLAKFYNGVAVPAHINRGAFSILSNLGMYDTDMGFKSIEISRGTSVEKLICEHPELDGLRFIQNSDAHSLNNVPDAELYLNLNSCTPSEITALLSVE